MASDPRGRRGHAAGAGSCGRPASRRSRRCRHGPSPTPAGSGAPRPTTSGSPGTAGRRRCSTSRADPAWARWWRGGAFDYAARGDRAARRARPRRRGARLGGRGRRGPPADERGARRGGRGRRADGSGRTASGRATGSGSSCRCSSRPWSRCWRSAGCRRSTRRSSAATARRPSRPGSPTARRPCSITADGFLRRGSWVPLKAVADEAVARAPSVRRVLVVRRRATRIETPWTPGRDRWWDEAIAAARRADARRLGRRRTRTPRRRTC